MQRVALNIRRDRPLGTAGFTMLEVVVTLGIFSVLLIAAAQMLTVMGGKGRLNTQQRLADLNQTTRLVSEFISQDLQRAGAGQVFAPRLPNSSPGYTVIPMNVTNTFGQMGPIPTADLGDGGSADSDQMTFVFSSQGIGARVERDDLTGRIRLDFQLRDSTQDGAATSALTTAPYPFFRGFFDPSKPSPYAKGITNLNEWIGGLLVIKGADGPGPATIDPFGQVGRRSQYRVVRILDAVPSGSGFLVDIAYREEPENPFNRWLQTLELQQNASALVGGASCLYASQTEGGSAACANRSLLDWQFYQERFDGTWVSGCSERGSSNSAGFQSCMTAALVEMRTFYLVDANTTQNTSDMPALGLINYSGTDFNYGSLEDATTVVVDGVEDLQVEYFFSTNEAGSLGTSDFTLDVMGQKRGADGFGPDCVGNCAVLYSVQTGVPSTHFLVGTRVSITTAVDVPDKDAQAGMASEVPSETNGMAMGNRTNYTEYDGTARFRRQIRQFIAFRNVDSPIQPANQTVVVTDDDAY